MLLVVLMPFDAEAVVVTEVHGEDVISHVGHTIPDDKVGGQPVPEDETEQKHVNENLTSLLNMCALFSYCFLSFTLGGRITNNNK